MTVNRRGIPTEHCAGGTALPDIDILRMHELGQQKSDTRITMLGAFAALAYFERHREAPEAGSTIQLRESDDLAVAAMFGIGQPNVGEQVVALVEQLNQEVNLLST